MLFRKRKGHGQIIIFEDGDGMIEYDFFNRRYHLRSDVQQWLKENLSDSKHKMYEIWQLSAMSEDLPEDKPTGYALMISFEDVDHAALFKLTWG